MASHPASFFSTSRKIPHIHILPPLPNLPALLVNLIKRPRIVKTTIPNLIHHHLRLLFIPTPGPSSNTQRRPPPHALLQLLRDAPLAAREKLPPPPALPRQRARANLRARRVPQVVHGVHLEAQVVVGMHHLVRQRVLHVPAVAHLVRADEDAVLGVEAASLARIAAPAEDAAGVDGGAAAAGAEQVDVVFHEAHDGRVGEEPFGVGVAAFAVPFFVEGVANVEVGGAFTRCGGVGEEVEEGGPGVEGLVVGGY